MKERLWTKNYSIGLIVLFGISLGASILTSVLPIFAKNLTGLDIYAGMITSAFALAALSMRFVSGKLVEKIGEKLTVLFGVSLTFIAVGLYLFCDNIYLTLACRILQGMGFGIAQTGITTYITTITPKSRMLEGINYLALFNSLSSVVGPTLAFSLIGEQYDRFHILFIVTVLSILLTFILMLFSKKAQPIKVPKHEHHEILVTTKLAWPTIFVGCAVIFFSRLSQSSITSFISIYAISLGLAGVGSFFTINALGVIASRFIIPRIVKKIGTFQTIAMTSLLFILCFIVISQATTLWHFLVVAFPAGIAMGTSAPVINVFLIHKFPKHRSGMANAFYYSSIDIAFTLGSLLWGGNCWHCWL